MIEGYFDETFDDGSRCTWVAGYLGDKEAWAKYALEWRSALGKREQLHMSSLRWKKPYIPKLLSRLGPIPQRSGLKGLFTGVRTRDFSDLIAGTLLEHYTNGYLLALIDVTIKAILKVPEGERLEIFFERRDQTEEQAEAALFAMRILGHLADADPRLLNSDGMRKLAKGGFDLGAYTVLFDPADYLCYALLQRHRDPDSERAKLCAPILEGLNVEKDCGLMPRTLARSTFTNVLRSI